MVVITRQEYKVTKVTMMKADERTQKAVAEKVTARTQ